MERRRKFTGEFKTLTNEVCSFDFEALITELVGEASRGSSRQTSSHLEAWRQDAV